MAVCTFLTFYRGCFDLIRMPQDRLLPNTIFGAGFLDRKVRDVHRRPPVALINPGIPLQLDLRVPV